MRPQVYRRAEVGLVEDVEEICPSLKRQPLPKLELPPELKSTSVAPNPRSVLRPKSPWVAAGLLNAAGSIRLPPTTLL